MPAVPDPALQEERTRPTADPGARATRIARVAAEGLVGCAAAGAMVVLARRIDVDPLDRVGQVSALAALGLRFLVLGLLALGAMMLTRRVRGGRWAPLGLGVSCAALAGLGSGFVAGGIVVALRGTPWPLFGDRGDAGQLARWIASGDIPVSYPPLAVKAMELWAHVAGQGPESGVRAAQILGTALFGPAVYLAWRTFMTPLWALAVGVTAALTLIDPYKPYAPVVLAVLVPVLVVALRFLRRVHEMNWRGLVVRGALLGTALGLLFLTYSGWFVWSAPGFAVAALLVVRWRSGWLRAVVAGVVMVIAFLAVAGRHVVGLLSASGSVRDQYFYFDVYVDPAYIAMWRGDFPGDPGVWPPPGELAGVGLFTLLLAVGIGTAIWTAGHRTVVVGLCAFVGSAWLMRFWLASQMFETQSVQLYPRTTQQILYCSLLLVGIAVQQLVQRAVRDPLLPVAVSDGGEPRRESAETWPGAAGRVAVAVLVGVLLVLLSAGSATADRYMPRDDGSVGFFAYVAQLLNG